MTINAGIEGLRCAAQNYADQSKCPEDFSRQDKNAVEDPDEYLDEVLIVV